jgi:GAF domain-containing protein
MSDEIFVTSKTKQDKYEELLPQIEALMHGEKDLIANLANVSAALFHVFDWLWVGFYRVEDQNLVLGPFQGPVACTRIEKGKGVCGKCLEDKEAIIVPNVHEFPGHIACSALSNSEIVVPVFDKKGNVILVLDIDSEHLSDFNNTDAEYLANIARLIAIGD